MGPGQNKMQNSGHYEHDRTDQPAIALWNAASHEMFDSMPSLRVGDARTMKQRAIERWENKGGEIPNEQRNQTDRERRRGDESPV
jgi:hypothetical protein